MVYDGGIADWNEYSMNRVIYEKGAIGLAKGVALGEACDLMCDYFASGMAIGAALGAGIGASETNQEEIKLTGLLNNRSYSKAVGII